MTTLVLVLHWALGFIALWAPLAIAAYAIGLVFMHGNSRRG